MIAVRDALGADRNDIVAMLARAFQEDPAAVWLQPDPAERKAEALAGFAMLFDLDAAGLRLTTPDRTAASLWLFSTESARAANAHTSSSAANETPHTRRSRLMMASLDAHKPAGDFWHLQLVGCEPERQGTGLGAAVVRAGLVRIGSDAAYLETANERNLGFYRAMGFTLLQEWDIPEGGPHYWSMVRS